MYMPAKKSLTFYSFIVMALVMSGCVSTDRSDLEDYVAEVLARPGGKIEDKPVFKPYEAYEYQSGEKNARDPFDLFYQLAAEDIEKEEVPKLSKEMEQEIFHRNKEDLEQFELDSLRMVGTLEDSSIQWGIVQSPDGNVHRVKVGNYLGRNIGKILNIFEDRIEIREIIKTSSGRMEEREAAIALEGS